MQVHTEEARTNIVRKTETPTLAEGNLLPLRSTRKERSLCAENREVSKQLSLVAFIEVQESGQDKQNRQVETHRIRQ